MEHRPKKLLDHVRDAIRLKHYSIRTEESYVTWIKRYILFHNKRHPNEMANTEIEMFLTHLAVDQKVAASTQNQALSALLFCIVTCSTRRSTSPSMPSVPKSPNACLRC